MRERAKPTLRTIPSTTTNRPSRRRNSRQIGRPDHGEFRVAPNPQTRTARAVLDREPLRRAAARLELRSNPSVARRQQRGRARIGRSPVQIGKPEIGDHPPPAIGPAGQQHKVRLLPDKAAGQEIARGFSNFRQAVVRIGRVQPPEPDGPAVRKRDIEALIDAGDLNPPGRLPASRKAATGAEPWPRARRKRRRGARRGGAKTMRGDGARGENSC